jgi:stage V sporulation protein R
MTELEQYAASIEELAKHLGLDYYNVDFEVAPASLMTEIAVYGLPVRMPHWSFGVRYIHQLVRQSMGHSKIFEVMFPGDPCRAFLMDGNSIAENTLVTAHVLGHADFSKNNQLFARFHEMAGGNIVEHAAAHAHRIQQAIDKVGMERVEAVLDAALALESHVDVDGELHRTPYPEFVPERLPREETTFQRRFRHLPGAPEPRGSRPGRCAPPFRRTPSSTCFGSSRTMRRSSSSGSATSSSRCAPSRCISTRCSPVRS